MTTYNQIGVRYPWEGGECPVAPKTKVKMYYRLAQSVRTKTRIAGNWDWVHRNGLYDIIAFEIVEFAK